MNHIKPLYINFLAKCFSVILCFNRLISVSLINFVSVAVVKKLVPHLEVLS